MQTNNPLSNINNFSFRGLFWIQLTEDRITIESPFLPAKVHLTLAYNSSSDFVNLHWSKNIGEKEKKPKVEIFKINKVLMQEVFMENFYQFIYNLTEPIPGEHLVDEGGKQVDYVSLDDIESEGEKILIGSFTKSDYDIIPKDQKLRVTADLTGKFQTIATNDTLIQLWKSNLKPISSSNKDLEVGVMSAGGNSIAAMKLFGSWYRLKEEHSLESVLRGIVSPATIQQIKKQFLHGLAVIKDACTNEDTQEQNKKSVILQRPVVRQVYYFFRSFGRSFYSL